jgi:hypothetical protein
MAVGFVGKGLGFMAAVVPLGVVTPPAILGSGGGVVFETFRMTTETGDTLKTETGDFLARHFNSLATEAGDSIVTETGNLLEV